MKINYQLICLAISISCLAGFKSAQSQGVVSAQKPSQKPGTNYQVNWASKAFDHQVFVENQGQFSADLKDGEKILYGARLGAVYAFITNKGIVYKFTVNRAMEPGETTADGPTYKTKDPDEIDVNQKDVDNYLTATWEGAGDNITTVAGEEQTYYNTYPKPGAKKGGTIIAHVFKTVTCRNVYPGIDVEYSFPKEKDGVKYDFIVHPGADASQIKLKYNGAKGMSVDNDGNVKIAAGWGNFMDHAPVSFYAEDNTPVTSSYKLNKDEETFSFGNLDASKTLTVDPWTTNWTQSTTFLSSSGYDGAYDVDYDYQGNVFIYGGYNPFELVKYNSAGVQQWSYSTTNFTYPYYGDFCVDKSSGISFACEGFNNLGALVDKISPAGALMTSVACSTSEDELWRATYDLCDHIILFAGGGSTGGSVQAATLDTNLTTFTTANVMNCVPNDPYHDFALIAEDPLQAVGYMASTHSTSFSTPLWADNVLYQMPLPAMLPTTYAYQDNYAFQEVFSVAYVGPGTGTANGMNGMAVSQKWVYMYDGQTLEQCSKTTGAPNATAVIGSTSFDWGGLDVDLCDDVYAGVQNNVQEYNSNLASTGTIGPFAGNVYDVVLGNGVTTFTNNVLYVCGKGFVTSIQITSPNPPTYSHTKTEVCQCACTATETLNLCGNPVTTGISYLWNNGQTTQTATGLCPNTTYTCVMTLGCDAIFTDTVNFPMMSSMTVTKNQTDQTCIALGTASVTVAGGTAPYTYLWTPNSQTTSNITGLSAGNYCVTVTDNTGCQDSVCFIISSPPLPTVTVPAATICSGSSAVLNATAAGGTAPYNYLWSTAAVTSSITVSPTVTTTYTVTVSDVNGCSGSTTVQVMVNQAPIVTIAPQNDTLCANIAGGVTLTATAAGNAPFTYLWSPTGGANSTAAVTPIVTTIYTVLVTDANGCSGTATTTVVIADPPTINVSATKPSICSGTSVTLIAAGTNITSGYTWQPGNLTGATVTVTPTVTTTYTVSASSMCGLATGMVTIYVNPTPVPVFSTTPTAQCAPACFSFRNSSTVSSGAISEYEWTFGNGDTELTKSPIYCYTKPGTYTITLTVTSDSGCSARLDKDNYITVYSNPIASFTASPQPTTIMQPTIQFTDQSTDAYGIAYWWWNFGVTGNDTISNLQNPTYSYWDTGTYCAREVVMNIHGCVDTVTNCLVINPIFELYIPSAFSPNGDGKNDVFMAKGNDVKSFEMYVYDRWGMELFHSTDINNGWTGNVKGGSTICQEDTYVYVITAYDNKNKKHAYIGSVNLIK